MQPNVTRTLRPARSAVQYPAPAPVSAERYIADRLGLTAGTAHQRLYGVRAINREAAICYRGIAQARGRAAAEQWLLPVTIARRVELPPYTVADHLAAHQVDLDENAATLAYLTDPAITPDEARQYARALEAEIGAKVALLAAVVARHGLERHGLEVL
jgi:hypothetical protein